MNYISSSDIQGLKISPSTCIDWVKEAFLIKDKCQLPPKISIHPQGTDFINTMPCLLPPDYHKFGCKVVSRIKGTHPALKSKMMVFDTLSGEMEALVDTDRITAMRTGAVATLAIQTLKRKDASVYSFIGLGVIGHATLDCLFEVMKDEEITVRLKKYKDHAVKTINEYSPKYPNVTFETVDNNDDLARDADVVVSCITDADGLLVEDVNLFKPGVLVVPVHTRGFQNCDLVFDKVFADDEGHVKGFKYFDRFRQFGELSDVLSGKIEGRSSEEERILSYNIGIAIHDILYAHRIQELLSEKNGGYDIENKECPKYYGSAFKSSERLP